MITAPTVQGDSLSKMVQALRICNYIVENLRFNMKLQVEKYFTILMDIVVADPSKGLLLRYGVVQLYEHLLLN